MENQEIAAVFEEIANLMKITQDDPKWTFKSAAYDRAKRSIESFHERLEDVARDPNRKLTDIPGIGADLAKKITELVDTGQSVYHQEQLAKVPHSLLDLLQLQSVGPQKVRLFHQQANVNNVDDLEAAAKDGRLRGLPGMSVKVRRKHSQGDRNLSPRRRKVPPGYGRGDCRNDDGVAAGVESG